MTSLSRSLLTTHTVSERTVSESATSGSGRRSGPKISSLRLSNIKVVSIFEWCLIGHRLARTRVHVHTDQGWKLTFLPSCHSSFLPATYYTLNIFLINAYILNNIIVSIDKKSVFHTHLFFHQKWLLLWVDSTKELSWKRYTLTDKQYTGICHVKSWLFQRCYEVWG